MKPTPAFIITTGRRAPGARLSKPGVWVNRPFESIDAALEEAKRLGGHEADIQMEIGR